MNWSDYVQYDTASGVLSWRVKRPGPTTAVGQEVGSVKSDGRYRSFVLFHRRYYVHRVIWELMHGPIPKGMCIDHVDGDGLNNRLENLRVVSLSENQRNRRLNKQSKSGVMGVFPIRRGFSVYCAGKYVGYFQDINAAAAARKAAEAANNYHPNSGRKFNATSNA